VLGESARPLGVLPGLSGDRRDRALGDLLVDPGHLILGLRDPAGQLTDASPQFLGSGSDGSGLLSQAITQLLTPRRVRHTRTSTHDAAGSHAIVRSGEGHLVTATALGDVQRSIRFGEQK
jgi:hypothetical protein